MSNEVNKGAEEEPNQKAPELENKTESPAKPDSSEKGDVAAAPEAETQSTVESEPEAGKEESQTGAEMDFGAILEEFEQDQVQYSTGELVKGKVVGISEHGALVDFGYKSEGLVPVEEFTSESGEVEISLGDEVEVVIRNMGRGDSPPGLSRFDAERRKTWDEIEEAFETETAVTGVVTAKTKGGLKVDLNGVEAFLPGSQVDSRPVRNLDALIGEKIEARVIKFSRKRNNIVLSRKVISDQELNKQKAETLSKVEEGFIVEGIVKNLTEYGAFVDIGGIDGLLHVTDMSWGRIHNPGEMIKVGETVQVKILKLDRSKEKISLGLKQLVPDPWSTVTELYPVNSRQKGRVSSITEYGAFVELEPGVEGLVHVSEMSWSKRLKHPKHLVKRGDEVEVQVLGIDPQGRRISLGIKQLQPNPWDTIGERFSVGSKITGKVRNLTDFGAFVELEEGIDGLVHVSDISWSRKIKHPKDVLSKGQEVEALITNIDTAGRRLSLSIKELTPSAWEQFTNEHKPGDVVKGTITRFASFGVFVELAPDLEGLCHISELSEDRIENPEDDFEIGQEMEFKILRIEHDMEKIGLSHRSVGSEDAPVADAKSYTSQAKGGMASLGELAKLKLGADEEASREEADEGGKAEAAEDDVDASAEKPAGGKKAKAKSKKAEADDTEDKAATEEATEGEVSEAEGAAAAEDGSAEADKDEVPAVEAKTDKGAKTKKTAKTDEAETDKDKVPAVEAKTDKGAKTKKTAKTDEAETDKKAEEAASDEDAAAEAGKDKVPAVEAKTDKVAKSKKTAKTDEAETDKKAEEVVAKDADDKEAEPKEEAKSEDATAETPEPKAAAGKETKKKEKEKEEKKSKTVKQKTSEKSKKADAEEATVTEEKKKAKGKKAKS